MLASLLRTVVPVIVGVVLVQVAKLGVDLDEGAATQVVTVLVTVVYYAAARLVEEHVDPRVGRFLLSFGLTRKRPAYEKAGSQ